MTSLISIKAGSVVVSNAQGVVADIRIAWCKIKKVGRSVLVNMVML